MLSLDCPGLIGTAILNAGQVAAREKLPRRKGRAKKEEEEGVVSRLVIYRTKVLMYRTMVLLARLTKVRR